MNRALKMAVGGGAVLGLLAAANGVIRGRVRPVPRWVDGEQHFYPWREGAVYYEAAGPAAAAPLLLVHDAHPLSSSYEMRQLFQPLAQRFRVYLVDSLGYGRSERPPIRYTAQASADLWSDFARDVTGGPVYAIANGASCAHVVAAAARHPERFAGLLLIGPADLEARPVWTRILGAGVYGLMRIPILGAALYNLLVSRGALAYALRRRHGDPARVTGQLLDDYWTISHQAGARWAGASYWAGRLDADMGRDLAELTVPLRAVWGGLAHPGPAGPLESLVALRPDLPVDVCRGAGFLVQQEQPEAVLRLVGTGNRD